MVECELMAVMAAIVESLDSELDKFWISIGIDVNPRSPNDLDINTTDPTKPKEQSDWQKIQQPVDSFLD